LKLKLCAAGIAAANRSHLKFFPDIDAYGIYHEFVVETGAIAVEVFAERVQALIVTFLRKEYSDKCADWCETYWTGLRGRMCLAHSRYSGCNNSMGVEVYWRLIKALCSCISSLGVFLGHLCHFIKTALGEEHRKRICDAGTPNAFICSPVATKDM
jgi:hypothetical protein